METSPRNVIRSSAYNEEVSIGSLVLLSKLEANNVVVVVDDGSTDYIYI